MLNEENFHFNSVMIEGLCHTVARYLGERYGYYVISVCQESFLGTPRSKLGNDAATCIACAASR